MEFQEICFSMERYSFFQLVSILEMKILIFILVVVVEGGVWTK